MIEEKVDDFIGQRFGKDGHLGVIGLGNKTRDGIRLYKVLCEKCREDAELFGNGVFEVTKSNLRRGKIPCGCSQRVCWTSTQYEVLIKRACEKAKFCLLSIPEGAITSASKVLVKCQIDCHEWYMQVGNLISGKGCPRCRSTKSAEVRRVPLERSLQKFKDSGKFAVGTVFWQDIDPQTWCYTCPECSEDEYVKAGLCPGIFKGSEGDLARGRIPCRCSKGYKWTKTQREYQIRQIILKEGLNYVFNGWYDQYKDSHSRIKLSCPNRDWNPSVASFVITGNRCPTGEGGGYKILREGFIYVIKVTGVTPFTGYGITGNFSQRLKMHKSKLSKRGLAISSTTIFKTTGTLALGIENLIKDTYECVPQDIDGFRTEATHEDLYESLLMFIELNLNKGKEQE